MKRFLTLAVAMALLASGCSDNADHAGGSVSSIEHRAQEYMDEATPFDTHIEAVIDDARSGGANDRQLELLSQAQTQGELAFEQARDAAHTTIECFQQSGLEASYMETTDAGIPYPQYMVTAHGDSETALRDQCETDHFLWVSYLY